MKSIWGRRAEEVGISVNVSKLFSGNSLEEDHLKLLADLVDKSITDSSVHCKYSYDPITGLFWVLYSKQNSPSSFLDPQYNY